MVPPALLQHEGGIGGLGHARQFRCESHRSVAGHEAVAQTVTHEGVSGTVVDEDGDGTLFPENSVAFMVNGPKGILYAAGHAELLQLLEDRSHRLQIGVRIEIVVDLEAWRSHFLDGLGLVHHILNDVHVIFEPVKPPVGHIGRLFGHTLGGLRGRPGRHRHPGADPAAR